MQALRRACTLLSPCPGLRLSGVLKAREEADTSGLRRLPFTGMACRCDERVCSAAWGLKEGGDALFALQDRLFANAVGPSKSNHVVSREPTRSAKRRLALLPEFASIHRPISAILAFCPRLKEPKIK